MILKKLYDEYGFNIEALLIKYYKKININTNELNVLLVLLNNKSKRKIFLLNSIAKKTDFSQNEVAKIIESLLSKKLLEISLETTNKISREVYNIDNLFISLTNILNDELNEDQKVLNKSLIAETIEVFESKLNRMLRPNELERIRLWYDSYGFNHDDIISAINGSNNNLNVMYIEKILNIGLPVEEELDDETNSILDEIFKSL